MDPLAELNAELDRTAVISEHFKDRLGMLALRAVEDAARRMEQKVRDELAPALTPPANDSNEFESLEEGWWGILNTKDNWGVESHTIIAPSGTAPLKAGSQLIRWPDGTTEVVTVVMKRYNRTVSDHGKSYGVSGEHPYIVIDHNGASIDLPLKQAGVELWAADAADDEG